MGTIKFIRQKPSHDLRLSMGLVGGLKKGESIIDYLRDSEIDYIWSHFDEPLKLIDYADDIIKGRRDQVPIKYPCKYVLQLAKNYGWPLLLKKGIKDNGY